MGIVGSPRHPSFICAAFMNHEDLRCSKEARNFDRGLRFGLHHGPDCVECRICLHQIFHIHIIHPFGRHASDTCKPVFKVVCRGHTPNIGGIPIRQRRLPGFPLAHAFPYTWLEMGRRLTGIRNETFQPFRLEAGHGPLCVGPIRAANEGDISVAPWLIRTPFAHSVKITSKLTRLPPFTRGFRYSLGIHLHHSKAIGDIRERVEGRDTFKPSLCPKRC